MAKVLVTGHGGQLSSEIEALSSAYPNLELVYATIEDLDITDEVDVVDYISKGNFQYCINGAAYTAVDKAEDDEITCRAVNSEGVKNLSAACDLYGVNFIHISSDYTYHNDINRPLLETDPKSPKGIYAITKREGDEHALENTTPLILKTSWVYSSFGHNFVKSMLNLSQSKSEISVVFDQIGTPTYAGDLAKVILDIISGCEKGTYKFSTISGIYNYSNEGVSSWYDFAVAIFEKAGKDIKVTPITTAQYPTAATRPNYSVLNKQKFRTTFGLDIPHWEQSLETCLKKLL